MQSVVLIIILISLVFEITFKMVFLEIISLIEVKCVLLKKGNNSIVKLKNKDFQKEQ